MFVKDFIDEYARYRASAEKAMAQVSDDALNHVAARDGNSIAMLVRHMSGNLRSRFTDFLTSDGEKQWRDRDGEFSDGTFTRAETDAAWKAGWNALESALGALTDDDLTKMVSIRGVPLTVHEALVRSVTHTASHVGQIVLLARILSAGEWNWITIPKGQSPPYNPNPGLEKAPTK
jgi:uncharacterized damage-inducible protein DinB